MSNKKNLLASIIVSLIIGVVFGVLLILMSSYFEISVLLKWALIITGIIVIFTNISPLVNGIMNIGSVSGIVDVIFAILGIVLGGMMIFNHGAVITVIVSVYLIAFPIIRIFLSGDWKNRIKSEWLRLLIGVLLLVFLPTIFDVANIVGKTIILISGWAVIGISVLLFTLSLISYIMASKNKNSSDDFIDVSAEEHED